jgi:uncharacterized membrane protein YeaQ/YmgE (transglycosylase-associated protein family)
VDLQNLIIFLIIGAVAGWIAGMLMRGGGFGVLGNIVVGVIGALIAGYVVVPFLGTGTINSNDFSLAGLLVSFAGAVILLAIVNLFRRGRVR